MIEIEGNIKNGRVLALVKDSYGNAFAPWLTPYFEKIIVLEPRFFLGDFYQTAAEAGMTALVVLNTIKVTMLGLYQENLGRFFELL